MRPLSPRPWWPIQLRARGPSAFPRSPAGRAGRLPYQKVPEGHRPRGHSPSRPQPPPPATPTLSGLVWGGQAQQSGRGALSASRQDVPVTLAGEEHAVLGAPGCFFVSGQRWWTVVLATSPLPPKIVPRGEDWRHFGSGSSGQRGPSATQDGKGDPSPTGPAC